MTNRLEALTTRLAAERRCALAPYLTAGDGGLAQTRELLLAVERAGAACVELGLAFSDPIADGPVLQAAAQRALDSGTDLEGVLALVRALRAEGSELPLALFSYANPLARLGWEEAARRVAEAGFDALLVPDLPVEEGAAMRAAALERELCPIFFAAPTSGEARVRAAAEASRGFLYVIGRTGVTGAETALDEAATELLARARRLSSVPLGVGFGLRSAAQVRAVARHAELAIVGSAMVQRAHEARVSGADAAEAVHDYARELVRALEDAPGDPR